MINGYLLRDVVNKVSDIHFTSSDEIHTLGHLYESMLKEMRAVVRFMVEVLDSKLGEVILDRPAAPAVSCSLTASWPRRKVWMSLLN